MTGEKKTFLEGEEGPAEIARRARQAARSLAVLPSEKKNSILRTVADGIDAARGAILEANRQDVLQLSTTFKEIPSSSHSLLERLVLDEAKVVAMAAGIRAVAALSDPSGQVLSRTLLDDGLVLEKVSCPIGVLLVVFESRPDAVPQIAALALKSGNAAILKGGRESARSTAAILAVFTKAYAAHAIPEGALTSVGGRAEVDALLALDDDIDLVIPRGGYDLVKHVKATTRIAVLGHAEGICHVYLDRAADESMAAAIVLDAKLQYPAACNAAETLLVHAEAARRFLVPLLGAARRGRNRTQGVCEDPRARAVPRSLPRDRGRLADRVRRADSRGEDRGIGRRGDRAREPVRLAPHGGDRDGRSRRGRGVPFARRRCRRFPQRLDALRRRVPVRLRGGGGRLRRRASTPAARLGLEGLVTYKYVLRGSGQVVATYSGKGARPFRHENLS